MVRRPARMMDCERNPPSRARNSQLLSSRSCELCPMFPPPLIPDSTARSRHAGHATPAADAIGGILKHALFIAELNPEISLGVGVSLGMRDAIANALDGHRTRQRRPIVHGHVSA